MDGKASGMHEIASMDRTSSFVRTLVRMQLSQNRQSSTGALDRLYERMKERGEEVDFDMPKMQRIREISNTSDNSSATEDEDDSCDVTAEVQGRERAKSMGSAKKKELLRTSTGFLYTPRRRSPMPSPPSSTQVEEDAERQKSGSKVYTVRSANHSMAMNRGLTLAEKVKRNYSKYIRTESAKKDSVKEPTVAEQQPSLQNKDLPCEEMSAPESRQTDSLSLPRGPVLNRSSSSLGLITTAEEDLPAEMARSSSALALRSFASLPTTPDRAQVLLTNESPGVTETHSTAIHAKQPGKGTVKKTEGRFHKRSTNNGENRAEVMAELRKAHGVMAEHMKEVRLRKAKARVKACKREQLLREERMTIFRREMDDIMKRLRDVNNRLDGRLRLLERDESLTKVEL